jgi:hypothetical protein
MTHVEQHKIILALRDSVARMTREEQTRFTMYEKRDRDDEELDDLSRERLETMHTKYCATSSKQAMDEKWKKLFKS